MGSVLDAFKLFDQDGDTYITAEELATWMARHGKCLPPAEIQKRLSPADKNKDGCLDKSEFVQIMTKKIILNQLRELNYTY